jgi:hypothetical protein
MGVAAMNVLRDNPLWLGSILVAIVAVILFTVQGNADVGDTQKIDTAQGIAEIVWLDDGDGTFTKQITVNGTVTAEPGTERENLLLWHDTLVSQREVARENARLRLISVKDDLLADLQQPNSPAVTRAIQAIVDIIETME